MAVAVAYPETQQGKKDTSQKTCEVSRESIRQARFVLRHCLEKAEEASETDRLIKRHINTTRYLLLDMRDRKGWKVLGFESFVEYGEKELNFASTHLYRLADSAEIALQIGFSQLGKTAPRKPTTPSNPSPKTSAKRSGKKPHAKPWRKARNSPPSALMKQSKSGSADPKISAFSEGHGATGGHGSGSSHPSACHQALRGAAEAGGGRARHAH